MSLYESLEELTCILSSKMLFPVLQEAGLQSSGECSHRGGGSGSGGSAESGLSSSSQTELWRVERTPATERLLKLKHLQNITGY